MSSAKEMIQQLRADGVKVSEIARELGRDPRIVYAILKDETPGRVYETALGELVHKGRVFTTPRRRRNVAGEIVAVRGAGGGRVQPEEHIRRMNEKPQGGRFTTATTFLADGGRQHEVRLPKGKRAAGRDRGNNAILSHIRAAARSQAGATQKQINLEVTLADGSSFRVKDYNASTLIKDMGGDALGFLGKWVQQRYTEIDLSNNPVTGVDILATSIPKTAQYRQNRA